MTRRTPPTIKWDSLERQLLRLTTADLVQFARKHAKETFYGFAFDCNSECGEVGLCANTEELLKEQRAAPDPNAAFWASLDKKLGIDGGSPATKQGASRWELGDWNYQGFNTKTFDRGWSRFQLAITERCQGEEHDERTFMTPTQAQFMEAVCRVIVRLERGGVFDVLQRTRNFRTLAMDHDESEWVARTRMRRIRRSESGV